MEAVGGDEREQRRAERDEHVRAEARLPVAQLALEADRAAEDRCEGEPEQRLLPPSDGTLTARNSESLLLGRADLLDPGRAEVEQLVEPVAVERRALRGRLHLDQPPRAGHDDVQVDVGARVLRVVEVEQRLAADDPERDRRDRARERG